MALIVAANGSMTFEAEWNCILEVVCPFVGLLNNVMNLDVRPTVFLAKAAMPVAPKKGLCAHFF